MRRSTINEELLAGAEFIRSFGQVLPPFASWSPGEMRDRIASGEAAGIASGRLGWDLTDYGQGRYGELGLLLFTTRNGSLASLARGEGHCYAEKAMISRRDQLSPMHRHVLKVEDIVNRGGATLALELFTAAPDGAVDEDAPVEVVCDGVVRRQAAGEVLRLAPGESVTLHPHHWHAFWGEGGDVLIGEVSSVNDDEDDNVFREPIGRFPEIEEDADPVHLLVGDYGTAG